MATMIKWRAPHKSELSYAAGYLGFHMQEGGPDAEACGRVSTMLAKEAELRIAPELLASGEPTPADLLRAAALLDEKALARGGFEPYEVVAYYLRGKIVPSTEHRAFCAGLLSTEKDPAVARGAAFLMSTYDFPLGVLMNKGEVSAQDCIATADAIDRCAVDLHARNGGELNYVLRPVALYLRECGRHG
jgi:hypothetical protein